MNPPAERAAAVHGGPDVIELGSLGLTADTVLDFSVCTNPFGPSPRVQAAIADVPLDRYPDRGATALCAALAEHNGVASERILAGNGVSELIWLTALALVRPGDRVVVIGPTYSEYARAAGLAQAVVVNHLARADSGFAVDTTAIERELAAARLLFVCNPNNPTGTALPPETILGWARRSAKGIVVVDEAYQRFAPQLPSLVRHAGDNLLVLRSMTKDHALAGLRLGYAVGSRRVIEALRAAQPPWSVNALAQTAGVTALGDVEHLQRSLAETARAATNLREALRRARLEPVPSAAHFALLGVGSAARVRRALLQRRILVRDCASFGLPEYIRVAPRREADNVALVAALEEVLQ